MAQPGFRAACCRHGISRGAIVTAGIALGEAGMNASQRGLLIGAIVLLGVGEFAWSARTLWSQFDRQVEAAQLQRTTPHPLPSRTFTRDQGYAFLAAAKKAEAIADPLQRCLAYPDPPDSHWSRDAVVAYCHYRMQTLLTFAEAQSLIQQGRSAELDRRLAAALHAQQTQPDARGLLDRIFQEAFQNGSFDIRPTLDAWKRDSPHSAFAFAASGMAYVAMAADARGAKYMKDTPRDSVESMHKLLIQADGDLRQAIALNPKVVPAYIALIHAGGLGFSRAYTDAAIRSALAVAPDDYAVRSLAMWTLEPKWGGSLDAMDRFAAQAQAYARTNPLMRLMLSERPYYEVDNCDCTQDAELAAYPAALDQLASITYLERAGLAADGNRNMAVPGIYLSEALRFGSESHDVRTHRVSALVDFDEAAWAVADMSRLLATSPGDADALSARAYAYEMQADYAHAEQDFRALLAIDPSDPNVLPQLGDMFVNMAHDWDKGWAVADQLTRERPDNPYGWILRAEIQQRQPRAGLDATADYLESHFGKDPQMAKFIVRMRAVVALRKHTGIDARPAAP
jgi:tetratricopeptide (TPR) repeat protein